MQEKEFNNLMDGKPAKWFEMIEPTKPTLKEVKEKEQPIPVDKLTRIKMFIAQKRANGMSEKNIRKAVKRKFKISVINK